MLSRERRVKKADVPAVMKGGASFHSPIFSVRTLLLPDRARSTAFATVISKKVAKLATRRNFLKRRVKYAINKMYHTSGRTMSPQGDGIFNTLYCDGDSANTKKSTFSSDLACRNKLLPTIKDGHLVIVTIKKDPLNLPYGLFEEELRKIFTVAHLI